jgi:hypothetical protein
MSLIMGIDAQGITQRIGDALMLADAEVVRDLECFRASLEDVRTNGHREVVKDPVTSAL